MYFNFVTSAYARHSERFRPPRSYFQKQSLSNTNLIMKHLSFLFRFCVCIFLTHCIFIQFALSQELPVANTIGTHSPFSDGFFRPQSPDVWSMIKWQCKY